MNVVALRRVVLLLSGLGFLCVLAEIPIQPNFDLQKFSGQWYPVSTVTKRGNQIKFVIPARLYKVRAKDRLDWIIDSPVKGNKCKKKMTYLTQLDQPGKYKTKNRKVVRIVETDYSSYFISHSEAKNAGFLALFARAKEASDDVKEKFKKRASSLGFPADKIVPIRLQACAEPKRYIN